MSRRAPLTGQPIDNTCHHSPAIHSTYVTTYYISKGYHSDPWPPRMYHCSKHHCLAISGLRRRHRGSSRTLLLSHRTIRDNGGSGQQWRSNRGRSGGMYRDLATKGQDYDKIWNIAPAIKQAQKRRFWALFIILTLKCCRVILPDNYRASV